MKYILAFSLLFVATLTIAQAPAVPQASLIANSLQQLTEYTGSLTQANWIDTTRGGRFNLVDATGLGVDSGIVFPSGKAGKFWKRDLSQSVTINAAWFQGFIGDSVTDATIGWKRIRDFFHNHPKLHNLYIPQGMYRITDSCKFRRGLHITTDGPRKSILIRDFRSAGHSTLGVLTFESIDSTTFIKEIEVDGLGFMGNSELLGHDQWGHEMALLGTDGAIVQNCWFYDFRGDGIYVGAGKSASPLDKRYNKNVRILWNEFDGGPLYRNRNGLSFIDVDGILVQGNVFKHIGNDTLSRSVGAIDFERNSATRAFSRNADIQGNSFIDINSINVAAITAFTTVPYPYEDLATFINVHHNLFLRCYRGVFINNGVRGRPTDAEKTAVNIDHNDFLYCVNAAQFMGRGIIFENNNLKGDSALYTNLTIGHVGVTRDLSAQDIIVRGNFFDSTGQNGTIEIDNCQGCTFEDNVFTNRRPAFYFYLDSVSSTRRKLNALRIVNNRMKAPAGNDRSTGNLYFINAPTYFNLENTFIQGNSEISGNILENRVLFSTGTEFYANHSIISAPPTVGSWDAGNELYGQSATTGSYALRCVKGGTYGTDADIHKITSTTSSNYFTYDSSLHGNIQATKLRAGNYVTITGSSKVYKIIGIRDSIGFYTDISYDGVSGDDTAAWTPPVFVNLPVNYSYATINSTSTRTTGNISTFLEGGLTADRTTTWGSDSTTLSGVHAYFRNNTTNDSKWTITPDAGVTFNGGTSSVILRQGEELHLVNTAINTWKILYKTNASNWTLNGTDIYNNNTGNVAIGTTASPYAKMTITNSSINVVTPVLQLENPNAGFGTGVAINFRFGTSPEFIRGKQYYRFDTTGNSATEMRFQVYNGSDSLYDFVTFKGRHQVGIGTMYPAISSTFDVASTTKGSRPFPVMSRNEFAAISAKANGLFAFGTTLNKLMYYDSTAGLIRPLLDSARADTLYAKKTNTVTVNGSTQQLGSNPSFTVAGSLPSFRTVASNITNNVNTAADVTGMSWAVSASKVYEFHIIVLASVDNTGGITFKFTLPTSTTIVSDFFGNSTSTTATMNNYINANGGTVTGYVRFAGTGVIDIKGYIQTTNSGTVQLQYNPTTTTQTVTILAGSSGTLWEVSAIGG